VNEKWKMKNVKLKLRFLRFGRNDKEERRNDKRGRLKWQGEIKDLRLMNEKWNHRPTGQAEKGDL